MIVDDPAVLAEVRAAFARYEAALLANDVAALDGFFRNAPETLRFGVAENLFGYDEIAAFRAQPRGYSYERELPRTVITSYGRDFATANTLFRRDAMPGRIGRQSQSWVRFPEGWRVVAAHVSIIDDPA